ncbi:MAG: hypothetical protein U0Q47_11180 [Mycobacterium sp.]
MSTLSVATVAAVGLYVPAFGFLGPLGACLPTAATASAAPSPTCASDLRECLRQSADLRQTTFGGRYVTAEDVARCMEAFNACIHGTLRGGNPNPPISTSAGGSNEEGLPQHFSISGAAGASDCHSNGGTVTCALSWKSPPAGTDSFTGNVSGTLSGMTMSGTATGRRTGHSPGDPSCTFVDDFSWPITYRFNPDGSVAVREGPYERKTTLGGSCSGSDSGTEPVSEWIGTWSAA